MASILRFAILLLLVFYVWHRLARRTGLKGGAMITGAHKHRPEITRVILRSSVKS